MAEQKLVKDKKKEDKKSKKDGQLKEAVGIDVQPVSGTVAKQGSLL
jgi:hypothetical protein